jgi:hypothetical protein
LLINRKKPLYFIHIFAPKRDDLEAELTRKIGYLLMKRSDIYNFKNESIFLPRLEASLEYLFPSKKAKKPSCYLNE